MADKTGGKGNKKKGRQKKAPQNLRYINEQRHEKSHIRRMRKHMLRWPNDKRTASLLDAATRKVNGFKR